MNCEDAKCKCQADEPGELLTKYIDDERVHCNNLIKGVKINRILKPYEKRLSDEYISTRIKPYDFVIRIPFTAKVRLTSILLKSTFKEMRIFAEQEVCKRTWKTRKDAETFTLPGSNHITEVFPKDNRYKDISNLYIVLIGNETPEKLFYLGFKGTFLKNFTKPIIVSYEAYSTESLIKPSKTWIIN